MALPSRVFLVVHLTTETHPPSTYFIPFSSLKLTPPSHPPHNLPQTHTQVTYHAVALTHALRAADRLAVNKLVTQLTRGQRRVALAHGAVPAGALRSAGGGGQLSRSGRRAAPFFDYLESCLRHKSEVVILRRRAPSARCGT